MHTHASPSAHPENGRELARISEGSCFGELALLRQETRAATVIATTNAEVGSEGRSGGCDGQDGIGADRWRSVTHGGAPWEKLGMKTCSISSLTPDRISTIRKHLSESISCCGLPVPCPLSCIQILDLLPPPPTSRPPTPLYARRCWSCHVSSSSTCSVR